MFFTRSILPDVRFVFFKSWCVFSKTSCLVFYLDQILCLRLFSVFKLQKNIFPDSHHTRTFTPRSLSCTPPHLYMADHVRKAAAQLHRISSNSSRQTIGSFKTGSTLDNSEIPTRFGKPVNLPSFVESNPHLNNKELSMGQKQYLWGIARIYSMSHMKSQVSKQQQQQRQQQQQTKTNKQQYQICS